MAGAAHRRIATVDRAVVDSICHIVLRFKCLGALPEGNPDATNDWERTDGSHFTPPRSINTSARITSAFVLPTNCAVYECGSDTNQT